LNDFYTGRFEGSFARGLTFQENPKTGDARISGTCASLAGLEKAIKQETEAEVALAVQRILLIHNIILSIGGIPLIYLGDEVGMLNDYAYRNDPAKVGDSRWVHRPSADPTLYAQRDEEDTIPGRIYQGLRHLIELRKNTPAVGGEFPEFIRTGNPHVFGYIRRHKDEHLLFLSNFSDTPQAIAGNTLRIYGLGYEFKDLVSGVSFSVEDDLLLKPCQFVWLQVSA
jgi:amylosucrase